jgi:preprotein translocase subunit SecE
MNPKTSPQNNVGDIVKWIAAVFLTLAGIIANYYYHEIPWSLRLAGWIILIIMLLTITLQTSQGKRFLIFSKDARMELGKVDWPTRQETVQFTVGVALMVVIMAVALWLIDTALLWIVKWFTG